MAHVITAIAAIGIVLGDKDAYSAGVNHEGELIEEARVAMTPAALRKAFSLFNRRQTPCERPLWRRRSKMELICSAIFVDSDSPS